MSLSPLYPRFSNCSANDHKNQHLWVKGASILYTQLNSLINFNNYVPNIVNISNYNNEHSNNLAVCLNKYRSDKANSHNYHILYSYIFDKLGRENTLNLLEIGLGTNNPNLVSSMGNNGNPGASLYAWEEYLPNSNIYGADIDREILFNKGRIITHYVDQMEISTYNKLQENFNVKYDIIIDDGLHSTAAQFNTLLFALENIKDGGYIIIEDIWKKITDNWYTMDYILRQNPHFTVQIVEASLSNLFVIHKLKK